MTAGASGAAPGWGAIFDWDGVIVDSSAQHGQAWDCLAAEEQRPLPEDHFRRGFGMKNENIIPEILGWTSDLNEIRRLSLRKEALYRDVIGEGTLDPLPGVQAWLEKLDARGIPCAVASSSHRANIDLALRMLGFQRYFSAIVTSEDVTRGKPDPEVFLVAGKKLGFGPERCVVFEDAHVGITAAHKGNMKAIAVATTHPLVELSDADLAVERLDSLDIDVINRWFSRE